MMTHARLSEFDGKPQGYEDAEAEPWLLPSPRKPRAGLPHWWKRFRSSLLVTAHLVRAQICSQVGFDLHGQSIAVTTRLTASPWHIRRS